MNALEISQNYNTIDGLISIVSMYRIRANNDPDGETAIDKKFLDDLQAKLYQYRELMEHVLKTTEV